jgi:hypothetical protein
MITEFLEGHKNNLYELKESMKGFTTIVNCLNEVVEFMS